jgi:hypothetical protein
MHYGLEPNAIHPSLCLRYSLAWHFPLIYLSGFEQPPDSPPDDECNAGGHKHTGHELARLAPRFDELFQLG